MSLSRSKFFDIAAFYGGSTLRVFYGLDRFSEDLDFSLLKKEKNFDMTKYCSAVKNELSAFGFKVEVIKKKKKKESGIESAFIKGETLFHLLKINALHPPLSGIHSNEIIKIKLEVDTCPPPGAEYEVKYNLNPIPHSIRLFSPQCLFAEKLHALLCRGWSKGRIKGRDLYDFVWFLSKGIPVHLYHLEKRMQQTGHMDIQSKLTEDVLLRRLKDRFDTIVYQQAKFDVLPFVQDPFALNVWSKEFFNTITETITFT